MVYFRPAYLCINNKMSRGLRKAIEHSKQRKETALRFSDEGVSSLYEVPELCKHTDHLFLH